MGRLMAVDQYGGVIHGIDPKRPRADLLDRLGASKCEKQYVDKIDGSTVHNGYIIGDSWYTLYRVTPWEKTA